MILIVTNREDYTADFLIVELKRRGAPFFRFNTEEYPTSIKVEWTNRGGFISSQIEEGRIRLEEVSSAWFRRPVMPVPSQKISDDAARRFVELESDHFLESIWQCLDCFWVSRPERLRRSENKLFQLKLAKSVGLDVPETAVTTDPEKALRFYERFDGNIVFKPLSGGLIDRECGVSLLYTSKVQESHMKMVDLVRYTPTLLQEHIPKQADLRVTVIGNKAFAVSIDSQADLSAQVDWRRAGAAGLQHQRCDLPEDVETQCVELVRSMGLEFGAIDFVLAQDGRYRFLEINPNGQWAWVQQLCPEIPLRESLADLLVNCGA